MKVLVGKALKRSSVLEMSEKGKHAFLEIGKQFRNPMINVVDPGDPCI